MTKFGDYNRKPMETWYLSCNNEPAGKNTVKSYNLQEASIVFKMCWEGGYKPAQTVSTAGATMFITFTSYFLSKHTQRSVRTHLPNTEPLSLHSANMGPQNTPAGIKESSRLSFARATLVPGLWGQRSPSQDEKVSTRSQEASATTV